MPHPEDLAADRHKEIRQAREHIAKAEDAQAQARERLEDLRRKLGPAERRDRERLGAALVDGKAPPASEAAKLRDELEQAERNLEAVNEAVDDARRQIPRLVEAHRDDWRRRSMKELSRARTRYQNAIAELAASRDDLSSEATLIAWLTSGELSDAANDALAGRTGSQSLSFTRTREELQADCERLAQYPATVGDPVPEPRWELAWTSKP